MAKTRTKYTCQQCGYVSPQYLGKCPECGNWNSFVETIEQGLGSSVKGLGAKRTAVTETHPPVTLSSLSSQPQNRISTGISELDHVLGGGLIPGQVVLLAGEPGVGKSTLLLQVAKSVAAPLVGAESKAGTSPATTILYASGEESAEQIYLRAKRLAISGPAAEGISIMAETNVENIINAVSGQLSVIGKRNSENRSPITDNRLLIVDSIQTMWTEDLAGAPGSVGQVRETAYRLIQHVKSGRVPLVIVGQVTKEGSIAGPKVLEHLVDTVLYMEGLQYEETRLLRVTKNRFGPTDEIAVFTMNEKGLTEVANPSANFLSERTEPAAGQAVVVTMEGTRPLLVEIQALVVPSELVIPRRVATGIIPARLSMIAAILSKYLRLPLGKFDIFVNVSGGYTIREPAADLGVALAIYSSLRNVPLPPKSAAMGELSLLGEIQRVSNMARRVKEAKRLGFTKIFDSSLSCSLAALVRKI